MMYRALLLTGLLMASNSVWSQCDPLVGHMPAFEIDVPEGVRVDSAFLRIENWRSNHWFLEGEGRSTRGFKYRIDIHDWIYNILEEPFSGPDTANYQIISGLARPCLFPGDWVEFDWVVTIYCSGNSGPNIDYSGPYPDDLAMPAHAGSVFEGINVISGSIDNTLTGGSYLYPDGDFDGYGSQTDSVLICADWLNCIFYRTVGLDCDDLDPNINPGAEEIPNNGIDENCDGLDVVTSLQRIENVRIDIFPNPATSAIYINVDGQLDFRISLYDITGKQLYSGLNISSIDIQSLTPGPYFLEIQDLDSGRKSIERIVKGT